MLLQVYHLLLTLTSIQIFKTHLQHAELFSVRIERGFLSDLNDLGNGYDLK
jgi:hypothetical protein